MKLGTTTLGTRDSVNILLWEGQRLSPLDNKIIAIDTETNVIKDFTKTPNMVAFQAFDNSNCYYVYPRDVVSFFKVNKSFSYVLHNFAFDYDVINKEGGKSILDDLIDNNQIWDTSILYRLWFLATEGYVPFKYNLAMIAEKFRGYVLPKDDHLRLNWGDYKGMEFNHIPLDMIEYGAKDVIATYDVYSDLLSRFFSLPYKELREKYLFEYMSHHIQLKGDLALNSIYKNGIGFDLPKATELLSNLDSRLNDLGTQLAHWGWVRGMKGGSIAFENAANILGFSKELPRTANGELSTKAEDLEDYAQIPFVKDYVDYHKIEKLTSFVRKLDSNIVHPRYNLLMTTGRTSCKSPNFQQLPKEGGIRQLFKAQEGNTFLITDYSTLELATLAQVCYKRYGRSLMRDKINDGEDLHKYYASVLYSKPISDVTKGERQSAKAANFGFPGGLGIATFIEYAKTYELNIDYDEAKEMRDAWFKAFPEMNEYMANEIGYSITETGRVRGNTRYTAEKNTPFQGLAADGAKLALYDLYRNGFTLRGFVHDEIITEVPLVLAETMLPIQERIMIENMQKVTPDVDIKVESMINPFYTK
jgi:DNA polymerase I-like protein with 3'-5' exonuclease and polymerase domains